MKIDNCNMVSKSSLSTNQINQPGRLKTNRFCQQWGVRQIAGDRTLNI